LNIFQTCSVGSVLLATLSVASDVITTRAG